MDPLKTAPGMDILSMNYPQLGLGARAKELKPLGTTGIQANSVEQHKEQVKGAAKQFEALLVQEMMKSMWSTVPQGGLLSGSNEEQMYRDMLNQAVADSVAEGKGIGIKEVIEKDINRLEKPK